MHLCIQSMLWAALILGLRLQFIVTCGMGMRAS